MWQAAMKVLQVTTYVTETSERECERSEPPRKCEHVGNEGYCCVVKCNVLKAVIWQGVLHLCRQQKVCSRTFGGSDGNDSQGTHARA